MIELQKVSKTFKASGADVEAVREVSLKIEKGDIFGIIGLSGAGKSTLVRCLNFLERPTEGRVLFKGVDLATLSRSELLHTRQSMSMIFQGFNLLEQRSAIRNVCFPLEISGVPKKEARAKAEKLLDMVGLSDRLNAFPSQLSGGQKQRVSIARALATDPEVLLCDEATSALDPNTTRSILSLLSDINKNLGVTIVVITHEMRVVEQICNKVAVLDHGKLCETGLVSEVFQNPKSLTARQLILPEGQNVPMATIAGDKAIRIVFDGMTAFEPVISNMVLECRATVNILYANTKAVEGKAVGQMVIQLPEDEQAAERIRSYLDEKKIFYKEEPLNE